MRRTQGEPDEEIVELHGAAIKAQRRAMERLRASAKVLYSADRHRNDPLQGLQTLTLIRHGLDDVQADLVTVARASGASWSDVAEALGVTRQSAWERYR